MKIVDLSRELYHRTPSYPGHPPIMHSVWKDHAVALEESGNVWGLASMFISMPDHGGTHIDAPRHFGPKGIPIDQYPLENCIVPGIFPHNERLMAFFKGGKFIPMGRGGEDADVGPLAIFLSSPASNHRQARASWRFPRD